MPRLVRTRLSAMMFLFYFALGSWVITLPTYLMAAPVRSGLNFTTTEVAWVFSTFALGALLSPLVVGLLTDRLFPADRVLAVACFGCGGLLLLAGHWCQDHFPRMDAAYRAAAAGHVIGGRAALDHYREVEALSATAGAAATAPTRLDVRAALDRVNQHPGVRGAADAAFRPLFWTMLAYCFGTQLCLTLTNVITLRNLPDAGRQFSRVRLYGTVGWIVAGNAVGLWLAPISPQPLYLAAAATAVTGLFALTLPRTPPMGRGRSIPEAFGLPALRMFRKRSFVAFVAASFGAAVMNQFYVVYGHRYLTDLGLPEPVQLMTIAQVVEVACMFAIPVLDPRKHLKAMMLVGLAGYALRGLVLWAEWLPGVVAVGVPMHGWGYAFFFTVATMYLDREAPPHLRASAQGVVSFFSSGLGPWLGNMLAAAVVDQHRAGTVIDWPPVWRAAFVGNLLVLAYFAVLFRPPAPRV